jgi:hypothetical protein
MREVVLKYNSQSTAPSRTVYYHYFEQDGETVRRTALLRAKGGDGDDTVEGFLRSHPHLISEGLQHASFDFEDDAAGSAGARTSAASAQRLAVRRRVDSQPSFRSATREVAEAPSGGGGGSLSGARPTPAKIVGHPSFHALKCSAPECSRWHHVPEIVMQKVRCQGVG